MNDSDGKPSQWEVCLALVPEIKHYNLWVDWGTGEPQEHITRYDDVQRKHTYAAKIGGYTVTITGPYPGFSLSTLSEENYKLRLVDILQWGHGLQLGNSGGHFAGYVHHINMLLREETVCGRAYYHFFCVCVVLVVRDYAYLPTMHPI